MVIILCTLQLIWTAFSTFTLSGKLIVNAQETRRGWNQIVTYESYVSNYGKESFFFLNKYYQIKKNRSSLFVFGI